jgi:hypothetical protein
MPLSERSEIALNTFTQIHVAICLAGILSGFVVAFGLITGRRLDRWTALFVLTTVATSVTGFFFGSRLRFDCRLLV